MENQTKKTILVIEDNQIILVSLLMCLKNHGFQTISAEDGLTGVLLAKSHLPDLIICDIMMPQLDGHSVLIQLRQEPATAKIPFIFLTGKADKSDARQGMNLGADDYLTKPYTRDELIEAVSARLQKQATITQPYLDDMQKALEDLGKVAYCDSLTNLPNRMPLLRWIGDALLEAQSQQMLVAVLCLNLDSFRNINLTLGYATGDLLLQAVAERLIECVGEQSTITRLNGDEFGILLVEMCQQTEVAKLARKILDAIAQPYFLNEQKVRIQASIGIALFPKNGTNPDQLLKNAELARRWCRKQGGGSYQFYSSIHG
jgi:diguanylate cyclase